MDLRSLGAILASMGDLNMNIMVNNYNKKMKKEEESGRGVGIFFFLPLCFLNWYSLDIYYFKLTLP